MFWNSFVYKLGIVPISFRELSVEEIIKRAKQC